MRTLFTPFSDVTSKALGIVAVVQMIAFIAIWTVGAGVIPAPLTVAETWLDLVRYKALIRELIISISLSWSALFYASGLAFILVCSSTLGFFKPVVGAVSALRFLGFSGITFLAIKWAPNADATKLWLMVFVILVFLLTSMRATVKEIESNGLMLDYARSLKLKPWRITYELVVLGKRAEFLDLIRQCAATGWAVLTTVEGLARASGGIGGMLLTQNKNFHFPEIFAIQITILIYGLLQDYALAQLKVVLCPYVERSK